MLCSGVTLSVLRYSFLNCAVEVVYFVIFRGFKKGSCHALVSNI